MHGSQPCDGRGGCDPPQHTLRPVSGRVGRAGAPPAEGLPVVEVHTVDSPTRGDDDDRDDQSRDEPGRRIDPGQLIIVLACLTEAIQFVAAILDLVS